jgi:conjugal transfer/entry exclusion protein
VTAQLTYEERLGEFDQELEDLQRGFIEAVEHLRRVPEADDSHEQRWQEISRRMKALRDGVEAEDYDKDQLVTLASALLDIRDQLDLAEAPWSLDVCDQLMILLERIRHVVRDALDEHVSGVSDDVGRVMAELARWLPRVSDQTIANLLRVDRRTLSRWRAQTGPPRRTLRVFAGLVAILRHNWDEEGVIAWFERPRRDLGGRRPVTLLDDPGAEDQLIGAARSGRNQYAS